MKKHDRKPGLRKPIETRTQRRATRPAPGKVTRTSKLPARRGRAVQRKTRTAGTEAAASRERSAYDQKRFDAYMDAAIRGTPLPPELREAPLQARGQIVTGGPEAAHKAAAVGIQGSGSALPHREQIQRSFGPDHDLSGVRAHIGGAAAEASDAMGAEAYATGENVAFRRPPDLHTAAHEAAHVVQQRAGVFLPSNLGRAGDAHERQADQVADLVVQGRSVTPLLDTLAGRGAYVQGASPPAVQRREQSGARAEPDGHAHAADHIEALLGRLDPVAGVGDPRAALDVLAALPLDELLATLDELEARGLLVALLPRIAQASGPAARVRTALCLRDLAGLEPGQASPEALVGLVRALEGLPADDQQGAFRHVFARRQVSPELEHMLEGMLALQSADVHDAEPTAAAGTTASAVIPAPIEPGPWSPGKEPPELYLGNQAHKAIAAHYERMHPGELVFKNSIPLSTILGTLAKAGNPVDRNALTETELTRRSDILNFTHRCLYEIKIASAIAAAEAQAAYYISLFHKAGIAISPGPSNDPGASGRLPAPGGVYIFWSPKPGVIAYEYRRGRMVPVPVAQEQGQEKRAPTWRWELEPLTKAQQQALATATAGTVMLILLMLLLAPVGA